MTRTIAYVEDQDETRESYAEQLRREGFEVIAYASKDAAIAGFKRQLPDLALLDVAHEGDRDAGYQVCSELRRISSEVPIIFLTHRHGEIDRISGLRLGADDYITKPFNPNILELKIGNILKQRTAFQSKLNLEFQITPKEEGGQIVTLTLTFNQDNELASLNMLDAQQQISTLVFSNIETRFPVPADTFSVDIPDSFIIDDQR